MASMTAALTTVELLEKILLCLPMLDILKSQRVSRLWKECIRESTLLQRKLFSVALPVADAPRVRKYSRYSAQ